MKQKKRRKTVGSILALIFILVLAVFLPRLVFMAQDYRQMNTIAFDSRESFEVLTTETTYTQDMNTRMAKLAGIGYGNITISKLARSLDISEFNELITNVKNQVYMKYLEELLPTVFETANLYINATQVETCDCYIVYDSDYSKGVIMMFWYMVFDIPQVNGKMELIVDSETESIYYVRFLSDKEPDNITDTYATVNAVVNNFPTYFINYYCRYYGIYYVSTVNNDGISLEYTENQLGENIAVGENEYTMAYALPYNGNNHEQSIFFRFYACIDEESGVDVSIGLPVIRRFIQ